MQHSSRVTQEKWRWKVYETVGKRHGRSTAALYYHDRWESSPYRPNSHSPQPSAYPPNIPLLVNVLMYPCNFIAPSLKQSLLKTYLLQNPKRNAPQEYIGFTYFAYMISISIARSCCYLLAPLRLKYPIQPSAKEQWHIATWTYSAMRMRTNRTRVEHQHTFMPTAAMLIFFMSPFYSLLIYMWMWMRW